MHIQVYIAPIYTYTLHLHIIIHMGLIPAAAAEFYINRDLKRSLQRIFFILTEVVYKEKRIKLREAYVKKKK